MKENQDFIWSQECAKSFELLKTKLVKAPILIFPNWSIKFHVHIDALEIKIGVILTQPIYDEMDYQNEYAYHNLKIRK